MIQISQIKCKPGHPAGEPFEKAARMLRLKDEERRRAYFKILKRSIDARRKPEISYVYVVAADLHLSRSAEDKLLKRLHHKDISRYDGLAYQFPGQGESLGTRPMHHRPLIAGMGPAGLFCGLMLARYGYQPVIVERGRPVEERAELVETFWKEGRLDPDCNVQFGEGGAGTFSDGKLNTMVKDKLGRGSKALEIFVQAGAPEEIAYINKPHIGTDILRDVVRNIRREIISLGGEVRFATRLTGIMEEDGRVSGAVLEAAGETYTFDTDVIVLAIGHSARDTFAMLHDMGIDMRQKAFAVGMRIEHPQQMINHNQYGLVSPEMEALLPAADYKLTYQSSTGRGVYSFCMCPGGQVVNSSSEPGRLTVNGMSNHARDGRNANAALIVTVTPEDYPGQDALAGIAFQRQIEEAAYQAGQGKIPCQRFGDFRRSFHQEDAGEDAAAAAGAEVQPDHGGAAAAGAQVQPDHRGESMFTDLHGILPRVLDQALIEGIEAFDRKIPGFAREDAVLSAVEARTSSPVRIERDEQMMSSLKGLIPCGEGPGYAGGIMSAAIDGMKAAETIARIYAPIQDKK